MQNRCAKQRPRWRAGRVSRDDGHMPNVRAEIAMSPDEVTEFIADARTLVLVTLGPDGFPDPVGMWYVPAPDGTLWMRTYAKSQKVLNLERDSRAAGLIEDGVTYDQLRGVQFTGKVELVDDVELICDVFADLMIRYQGMDPAYRDATRAGYLAKAPKQRALHLVPDRVVSWDHRKQRAASDAATVATDAGER
jgi:general stress protein 26